MGPPGRDEQLGDVAQIVEMERGLKHLPTISSPEVVRTVRMQGNSFG
jgi:hypothetical protein